MNNRRLFPAVLVLLSIVIFTVSCTGSTLFATKSWSEVNEIGENLVLTTKKGEVILVNPASGKAVGQCETSEGRNGISAIYGTPLINEGFIYIGGFDGAVYKINPDSLVGSREDSPCTVLFDPNYQEESDPFIGGPSIKDDILLINSESGLLYAIDINSGAELWPTPFQADSRTWNAPTISGNTVYIGTLSGKIYSLDFNRSGFSINDDWNFKASAGIGSITLDQDVMFITSFNNKIYAINRNNAEPIWQEPFEGENWFWAAPVLFEDRLFAPSLDHKFYILDKNSGRSVAEPIETGGAIRGSAAITGNLIFFANEEGETWWIDATNLTYEAGGKLPKANYAGVSNLDGTLYIHTDEDLIFSVRADSRLPLQIFPFDD
ncbi:MAG: PQQ-binding-like beta-propeller repeat protein [Chloroflexota bacterium]|nr:PQQ-binding-like beta-propeller repeat protein [Chloroflexota bacterium]